MRHRDFRLFWIGAMVSFTGSWVQMTGQQWLVYELTGSSQSLGLLTFLAAAPLFFLSPLGGWLADRCNKRAVLVACSSMFALTALVLAAAVYFNFVSFPLIAALAFVNGVTSVLEIPTRQSMISNIVDEDDIGSAIPLNSATFNLARVIGPVIGGQMIERFGVAACYLVNGLTYASIILAVLAIRSDLRSTADRSASLRETLFEGLVHVWRNTAFRTIVLMMMVTSLCGIFYISMISAFAKSVLKLGPQGYSNLLTATGVGAILGVAILTLLSRRNVKGWIPLVSMTGLGAGLIVLSFARTQVEAVCALAFVGMCGIGQMVGTNTALQFYSPPELRGRIVAVHVWSMAGINPIGALGFGWLSQRFGLPLAFLAGGSAVFLGGFSALLFAKHVRSLK
jgi:predicted MFS family arabinose efflux permease